MGGKHEFPGHCFAQFFQGEALAAALKLDSVATGAELRRVANSHANAYAAGTFGLFPEVVNGRAVWHVVQGPWTAATCLGAIDRTALVGAVGDSAGTAQDVTRQVHEVAEKVDHVATEMVPDGAKLRRRFYFSFTLGGGAGEPVAYTLHPTSIPRVISVAKMFESAKLVNASVEVVVEASASARVGIGLNTVNSHARDMGHVRRMAHNMVAYGKVDAPRVTVWDLPERMTFSREYKMPAVGNGPAYICFLYSGGVAEFAEINGFLEMEFAGEGITMPIRIDPSEQKRVIATSSAGVANTSRHRDGTVIGNETDEEEDEDDD